MSHHLEKLFNKNEEYFKMVRGGLVCGTCVKPRDLALDYKKGQTSTYTADFLPHASGRRVPKVAADFFEGFNSQQPMELSTINRTDYVAHHSQKRTQNEKKEDVKQFLPFAGASSYRYEFVNWGSNPTASIKPAQHPTVLFELPFVGRSMYSQTFLGKPADQDIEREKIINTNRRGQFKSPINSDFPFLSRTSSGSTFVPGRSQTVSMKPNRKPLPNYLGQYDTTHRKDFSDKKCLCNGKNCIICGQNIALKA